MFKDLLKFEVKRNLLQAIGFYLFFLIIGGLIFYIVGAISAFIKGFNYENVGFLSAIIYCPALSLIILLKKKLYTSPIAILVFLLTFIATLYMGALLGVIAPAILSTFDSRENNN